MSTTITKRDPESEVVTFERLPLAERIAAVNQLHCLEGQLFDGENHIRQGLRGEQANELLEVVNSVRHRLGWLPIDDHHRRGWLADVRRHLYGHSNLSRTV
jgi:hypothetical protein